MSSKLFSRSGVFAWSPRGVEAKGLIVADFAQFFDPNDTSIEQKIDFLDKSRLFEAPNPSPNVSVATNYRFNELAWSSMCSDAHPQGIFAGGTEDGTVVFFDAEKLVKESSLEILSSRKDHHGHVLTIDVSRDGRWMASGGGVGQILLWDLANLKTPFSPGAPNFQDQVKILRWNQKNESVFASISSRRVSCWDLRRNGAPVLEFAELPNCDWSSLCWNPSDASQLIVGSQSQQCSIIQKWDSRFISTPIKEYRHHQVGITSIDWNKADDRLLISSGCDGQVIIWNHETSEVLGGVGSLQGDWIRNVKWNEEEPAQFAIQYFRHPIQIGSLTSLGAPQPGAEVLAARITDQFVPAWHRAPLTGSSIAYGARLATFWKSYDAMTQKWSHNVEVETISPEEDISAQDISQYLHVKDDKRNLGWYLHEKAYAAPPTSSQSPEDVELERSVWLILLGLQEKAGRNKLLQYLGIIEGKEEESKKSTSHAATSASSANNTTTRSQSAVSNCSTDSEEAPELSLMEKCSTVQWDRLDTSGWDLLLNTMRQDHLQVIKILMTSRQHVAAMMYAAQHESERLPMILEDYNRVTADPNPLSALMLALSTSSNSSSSPDTESSVETEAAQKIDEILKTFPDEKWKELLGLIIAHEAEESHIKLAAKCLGTRWLERGKALRACIAFLIAEDVDQLLLANTSFSPSDRLKQALVLHQTSPGSTYPPGLERHVIQFAERLLNQGAAQIAWNLVKSAQNGSTELQELQWLCYNVAGGKDCTGDVSPRNPYDAQLPRVSNYAQQPPNFSNQFAPANQNAMMPVARNGNVVAPPPTNGFNHYTPAQSQAPPPPGNNYPPTANMTQMPPSSTLYQTQSWDHKPPPAMPSNMPPSKPAAPVTPGWNDPPPMTLKQTAPAQPVKQNVMEISWKPMDMAPAPGGMMAPSRPMNGGNLMQSLSLQNAPSSTASSSYPSPASQATSAPAPAPPPIQLSPDDEKIMEPINNLAAQIIETARVQAKIGKATELRARIQAELPPRLAANRLSAATKHHLTNMAYFLAMHQVRDAQAVVAQMARNASDFVEISSFLPALKSLLALSTH